jgi:hypothetical protein
MQKLLMLAIVGAAITAMGTGFLTNSLSVTGQSVAAGEDNDLNPTTGGVMVAWQFDANFENITHADVKFTPAADGDYKIIVQPTDELGDPISAATLDVSGLTGGVETTQTVDIDDVAIDDIFDVRVTIIQTA